MYIGFSTSCSFTRAWGGLGMYPSPIKEGYHIIVVDVIRRLGEM